MSRRTWVFALAIAAAAVAGGRSQAALITGWGLETGQANATLTEGSAGSFSTTVPTGNAAPRALLASPISLTSVGSGAVMTGKVTMSNAPGNQQFRFGIWDTNGKTTGTLSSGVWVGADPNVWLGYMTQVGGGGGNDDTKGRTTTGAWLSNTGAYSIGTTPGTGTSPPAATVYDFLLRVTRTSATTVQVDYSFVGGGGSVNRSGTFNDDTATTNHQSAGLVKIDAVGFLLNGSTGSGTFTDVDVRPIPEPTALALVGAALAPAAMLRRRKSRG